MIVWLSGGSSGLGLYTAQALAAEHTVIAGARSFREYSCEGTLHRLPLDVTDDESVAAFRNAALALAPRVDALVHCAGLICLGACEDISPGEYRQIMETNYIGMVRMNQAALPLMRAQGGGKIIMFSSINGLLGIPFQSAYVASKHAVEGYAECLQQETHAFGVQVCVVEPGDHRGGSRAYRAHAQAAGDDSPYAGAFRRGTEAIDRDERNGSDPEKLGRRVARILSRRRLPFRLMIASPDQRLAALLHRIAPARLVNGVLRRYYLGR